MEGDRAVSRIGRMTRVAATAGRHHYDNRFRVDAQHVIVQVADASGRRHTIGTGWDVLRGSKLTSPERAAVRAAVDAVALLHHRFGRNGFDNAGHAVTLVLRSAEADDRGPFAEEGTISAGSSNPLVGPGLGGAGDRILPLDVAIHELVHVVQFAELSTSTDQLHPALAEGFADALSMLLTRDWSIGEGYFHKPGKVARETIRQVGPSADGVNKRGESVVVDYRTVAQGSVEEHAAGAVISRTFYEIQQRIGWSRAEDLIWSIINDPAAWKRGGSWQQVAVSMVTNAQKLWPGDAAVQAAVGAAMRTTHIDEATDS